MQWSRLQSLTRLRRSFKTCGISNALNGLEDDAIIYDNEMPEVADDDMEDEFETDFKKTMMTKNLWKLCMTFSQTKTAL